MIEFIKIEKLHPHPDNPRKDLGDLTELADSIKRSGILQNLTVIPATGFYHGDYTVIIGHRRCAAAKLAGLTEVPCVVCEMDYKEQIATMLLENMQRNDLTVYEQAQGLQMMLDLGESIEDVSEKTGFSESTVRRRVRLLKLDKDKFQKSQARQVSFMDYEKLFEIEDEEKRNELLDDIGTNNFNNKFLCAKNEQKRQKEKEEILSAIRTIASEVEGEEWRKMAYVICIRSIEDIQKIDDGYVYKYHNTNYGNIYLYREYTEQEVKQQKAEKEAGQKAREKSEMKLEKLGDLRERFFELRYDFVKNLNPKEKNVLCEFAGWCISQKGMADPERFLLLAGIYGSPVKDGYNSFNAEFLREYLEENAFQGLLYMAYTSLGDSNSLGCHNYIGEHFESVKLKGLYKYLIDFGYEMSDEEKAYMDGTHKLYEKEK